MLLIAAMLALALDLRAEADSEQSCCGYVYLYGLDVCTKKKGDEAAGGRIKFRGIKALALPCGSWCSSITVKTMDPIQRTQWIQTNSTAVRLNLT
jgi:hypothetical protein